MSVAQLTPSVELSCFRRFSIKSFILGIFEFFSSLLVIRVVSEETLCTAFWDWDCCCCATVDVVGTGCATWSPLGPLLFTGVLLLLPIGLLVKFNG